MKTLLNLGMMKLKKLFKGEEATQESLDTWAKIWMGKDAVHADLVELEGCLKSAIDS